MDKEKFQKWMIVGALFGSLYLYIQAYKIFQTKETAGVSELAFIITLISSIVWLVYGFIVNDIVIKVSSIAGIIGSILILVLLFMYRDVEPEPKIEFSDDSRSPEDIITAYNDHRVPNPWLFVINDTADVITADCLTSCSCRK